MASRILAIIAYIFAIIFALGAVAHLVLGQVNPDGYAAFGDTAWPPLDALWADFVMPNIRWLTIVMAAIEAAIAYGLFRGGRARQIAVVAACSFFVFLIVLGYGWPTESGWEDLLKNRIGNFIMIAMLLPSARPRVRP